MHKDHVQLDFYPRTVAYTGTIGHCKPQANQIREHIKDSGIDSCLSSSCQTLTEDVFKAKVVFCNVGNKLELRFQLI